MEDRARRRMALLASHISPEQRTLLRGSLSTLNCASDHTNDRRTAVKREADCVFCEISRGEAPAFKVYEDDSCLCILDTYPLCYGHSLLIPKQHFSSLDATPPSVIAGMFSKVPLISHAVMKAAGCDSFNLLVNNGVAAGQVILHTHIHIIPRKAHDCLWTSESLRRLPLKLDQEASKLAKSIQDHLSVGNDHDNN